MALLSQPTQILGPEYASYAVPFGQTSRSSASSAVPERRRLRFNPKGGSQVAATIISLAITGLIYILCQVGAAFYLARIKTEGQGLPSWPTLSLRNWGLNSVPGPALSSGPGMAPENAPVYPPAP